MYNSWLLESRELSRGEEELVVVVGGLGGEGRGLRRRLFVPRISSWLCLERWDDRGTSQDQKLQSLRFLDRSLEVPLQTCSKVNLKKNTHL